MTEDYKRIGVAFTKPEGPTRRRREYGIYQSADTAYGVPVHRKLYAKYEGYREQRPDGEASVGLPLGGPNWRPEPMIDFYEADYAEIRFFEKCPHGRTGQCHDCDVASDLAYDAWREDQRRNF